MILKVAKTTNINGTIRISGSKNSSLALICASLLSKEEVVLNNVPDIEDIKKIIEILRSIGSNIKYENNTLTIQNRKVSYKVNSELVRQIRGSSYLIGALLARCNKVEISEPGGCNFCDRPIDLHLYAANLLGYVVKNTSPLIIKKGSVTSNTIIFPKKSVGATINTIFMASNIDGITTIINPSLEPEVLDVCKLLKKMSIEISIEENKILINGVKKLTKTISYPIVHEVIPDRIEAGSYLLLASSFPNSKIEIQNVDSSHLTNVLILLKSLGAKIIKTPDSIKLESPQILKNTNLIISEYPYFPTDLQQILSSTLLFSQSKSIIEDRVFPKRLSHLNELKKLGAKIYLENEQIIIEPSILSSSIVEAKDLRCAMALVIAAAHAEGVTLIEKGEYLLRGYENPLSKMKRLGVNVDIIY